MRSRTNRLVAMVAVALMFTAIPASAESAPTDLHGNESIARPESSGSVADQARATAILRSSEEFRTIARTQMELGATAFAFRNSTVRVNGDQAVVAVGALDEDRSVVVQAAVDLGSREVTFLQQTVFTALEEGSTELVVRQSGSEVFRGTVTEGDLVAASGYEQIAEQATCATAQEGETVVALGACEWAVGALCGTGGTISCYLV